MEPGEESQGVTSIFRYDLIKVSWQAVPFNSRIIRQNAVDKKQDHSKKSSVRIMDELWDYFENSDPVLLRAISNGAYHFEMSGKPRNMETKEKKVFCGLFKRKNRSE